MNLAENFINFNERLNNKHENRIKKSMEQETFDFKNQ